jgi:type II secretory pathway component GspD/PulD (secretin)
MMTRRPMSFVGSAVLLLCGAVMFVQAQALSAPALAVVSAADTAGSAVAGQPLVTNIFYESDLVQALADISNQTSVPIITDGTVGGTISVDLREVPLERALERILYPLGFTFARIGDYYLVGSTKPDAPSFPLLSHTEVLALNYTSAEDAFKLLADFYGPYLKLNAKLNTLTITAAPQIVERARADIARIDEPKRQVMIEALVTEMSTAAAKSVGIDWSGTLLNGADTILRTGLDMSQIGDSGLSIGGVVKQLTGRLGGLSYSVMPSIKALVRDGKAKIRANPRIVTADGQPAEIVMNKEQYYQLLTGAGSYPVYSLEKIEAGVSMTITPYVSSNGDITVMAEPVVSDVVGTSMGQLPIVSKRSAKTKVVVRDGEDVVIGGLTMQTEQLVQRKIPLLGDIPILGLLFSSTKKVVEENEVVIIITPHLQPVAN